MYPIYRFRTFDLQFTDAQSRFLVFDFVDPLPWERRQLEAQKQQEEYARKKVELEKKQQEASTSS